MRRVRRFLVVAWLVAGAGMAVVSARLPREMPQDAPSSVVLVSSCTLEAGSWLARGLTRLYAQAQDTARLAFETASDIDRGCAMAHWGQAMAWIDLLGEPPSPAASEEGLAALRRAEAFGAPTDRERGYLAVAAALFERHPTSSHAARLVRFREATARLIAAHPEDPEAAVLHAFALLAQAGSRADNAREAAGLVEATFGGTPGHAGAAQVLMIARERSGDLPGALGIADRLARGAPAVPEAFHPALRVFERTGSWERLAESAAAAWRVSEAAADGPDHRSLQWWVHALLQRGEYRQAAALVAAHEADAPAGLRIDLHARSLLERRAWREALALPDAGGAPGGAAVAWFVRGLAAARLGRPDGDPAALAVAHDAARRLDNLADRTGRQDRVELWRLAVRAAIAAAQEERDEMGLLLAHARSLDSVIRLAAPRDLPMLPIGELAGDLWLQVDRYRAARDAFEDVLARHPRRARSLLGLARAARAAGDRGAARTAYAEFRDVWQDADADRPEVSEAQEFLAAGRR